MRIATLCLGLLGAGLLHAAEPARSIHIVELDAPPALEFAGDAAHKATRPAGTRYRADTRAVRAYLARLDAQQASALADAETTLGRTLAPSQRYRHLLNGFALALTAEEATRLARRPGIARVEAEEMQRLHTDASPSWIGAEAAWAGVPGAAGTRGEGMVVGVIDSGIAHAHPAFAEVDGAGFRHVNPRGRNYGLCAGSLAARCNGKLIGIYDFGTSGAREGVDLDGHGSHVAGTAVGNLRNSTIPAQTTSLALTLSGVAPRAHLISYKACQPESGGESDCPSSQTMAALEQAVIDDVDVVNYSLGGTAIDPWPALTGGANANMRAMTNAVRAGLAFAVSVGNDGPASGVVASPSNLPWVLAVAATTSQRRIANVLTDFSGAQQPSPVARHVGAGLAGGVGPVRIVLGADFGSARCSQGESLDNPPTGISSPWTGQVFSGQIVVCDRGVQARVAKGFNVQRAGGGGMVLVNTEAEGDSVVADDHFLPATHLGYLAGEQLKAWVRANPGSATARLTGTQALRDPAFADIVADFSSRGPDPALTGVLKPDISAPGVDTLAPAHDSNGEASISGTSMSSPHIAGVLALLRSRRSGETPGTLNSALQLTAIGARSNAAGALADPLLAGSGRVRADRALAAGLVMPIAMSDFERENPRAGGDPARLNLPVLYRDSCRQSCSFTRSFRAWRAGSYSISDASPIGMRITAAPASFTLGAGASQQVSFTVDVSGASGRRVHGEALIRASDSSIPDSRIVASVFAEGASSDPQDEPSLSAVSLPAPQPANASCPAGFFIATVSDGPGPGLSPGTFGMELLLDQGGTRLLDGGLNFGGLVDNSQVGFAGFNFTNPANENQRFNLALTGSPADDANGSLQVRVRIIRQTSASESTTVYESPASLTMANPTVASITVPPGFYVATVAVEGASAGAPGGAPEGQFFFSLSTSFVDRPGGGFQGGAVVGGYHATHPFGGTSGFAAFCIGTPHSASMRALSAPTYGPSGARDLRVAILDANQALVAAQPGSIANPNQLQNGVAVNAATSSTSPNSDFDEYTVLIPAGATNLEITTSNAGGDLDLYVRAGSAPSLSAYDCRPFTTGGNERCAFATPIAGTYFVRVYGFDTGTRPYTIRASWTP